MPTLTENDFLLMDTACGWSEGDRHVLPTQEALEALAISIPIPVENRAEFYDAMQRLQRWFCDKALTEANEKHKKAASLFRVKLDKIKELTAELMDEVKTLDVTQLVAANVLATSHRNAEGEILVFCQRTFSDLNRFASLCEEVEIEIKSGPDRTLLRYTISRLAAEYKRYTGNDASFSNNEAGEFSTPFRRLVTGFFSLLPEEIARAEGINPDALIQSHQQCIEGYLIENSDWCPVLPKRKGD